MPNDYFKIETGGTTNTGCVRDHNEDSYYTGPQAGVWVVADGMGGHESGEVASRIAVDLFAAGCGEGERQTSPGEAFTYLDNATARDVAAGVAAAFFGRHLLDDPGGLTPILRGHPSGVTTASLRE